MMDKGVNCVLTTNAGSQNNSKMRKNCWLIVSLVSLILAAVAVGISVLLAIQLNHGNLHSLLTHLWLLSNF